MRFLSASQLYTCASSGIIENGTIVLDADNCIIDILDQEASSTIPKDKIEFYKGILTPGFINAHCHLELSYLKDKIAEKLGLDYFIKSVEANKHKAIDDIQSAAALADAEMYKNGIVAVGDICNTPDTIVIKSKSKIYYHNFIETYAFNPSKAPTAFEQASQIKKEFHAAMLSANITPHAPYSVSYDLLKYIDNDSNELNKPAIISIHNQESEAENLLFQSKSGKILDRLKAFGIDDSHFLATGKSSLLSIMPYLNSKHTFILVHNTVSTTADLIWMQNFAQQVYWCFCPKANRYIEDTLPNFEIFKNNTCQIVLGTDSLASNNNLNLLEEIQTILKYSKVYTLENLITAACINGAKALKIEAQFGSLEIGKRPGINALDLADSNLTKLA